MRRFELKEGSSSKFWEVTVSGSTLTVRFGRIGSAGQEKSKTFPTPALAQKEHDKLIEEKLGKGYQEVGEPRSDKAAAPAATAKTGRPAPKAADDILLGLRRCKPLKRVASQLESLQRISIRITTAPKKKTPVGMSKLGGQPDLPAGVSWPVAKLKLSGIEISLPFIAQFNLAELHPYDGEGLLPDSGMLYFFYNREPYGPSGKDFLTPENWSVVYHTGDGNYAPATAPIPIPPHMDYGACAVAFHNEVTLPHVESYYIGVPGNKTVKVELMTGEEEDEEEEWDAYAELLYELRANENIHQMLGYADGVQPYTLENSYQDVRDVFFPGNRPFKSLSEEEQSEEIFQGRLLLQVSGETSNKMEFGQGGRLFFFIREQDLKARDFSKVWVNEQ
jgi:uncharacterized protein YwqG/predicted DNA-binding WGR domain protein